MIRRLLLTAGMAWMAWALSPPPAPAASHNPFMRGIALAEVHPGHDVARFEEAVGRIRSLGADWTLIPVYGFADSAAAPEVDAGYPSREEAAAYRRLVRDLAREARSRGLSVLLVPYVNLRVDSDADWRGNLRPADWARWFRSYADFLDVWVDVAVQEETGMLAVGAELVSSERHADEWRKLIARVRSRYRGRLIYSCNWDHFREVPFHDALDVVGLSGYYSLPYDAPLTALAVESNWREVKSDLVLFSHEIGRRILFTEIGYPSFQGAARDPWNYTIEGRPDPAEQARSLSAFFNVWAGTPELEGVFVWNYSPLRGGLLDTSYSINGKPAESVVRSWFSGRAGGPRDAAGR